MRIPFCLLIILLMVSLVCGELVQLVTMFRHGARYHINSFYDGNETIPNWGKLTSVGMRQHYTLGSMVRDLYSTQLKFLRPNFNHSEVEVYSTDVDRTINSAQSHLFGMFPNNTGPKIPEGLSETLMVPPYSYNDTINSDYALPNGHDMIPIRLNGFIYICDNLTKEVNKNVADEHATIDQMNSRYKPIFDKLQQVFKLNTSIEIRNCSNLVDAITVDKFMNRPLPSQLTNDDYNNIIHLQAFLTFIQMGRNVSRAACTSKINKILTVFDRRISSPNNLLKLTVLSGHDSDISPMLLAMNFSSSACIEELYRFGKTNALNCQPQPMYAANIIWELHQDDTVKTNYYVKVRSNGKLMNLCERQSKQCDYNQWRTRVLKILIDVNELCPHPQTV